MGHTGLNFREKMSSWKASISLKATKYDFLAEVPTSTTLLLLLCIVRRVTELEIKYEV